MKRNQFNKKLVLSKRTISNLRNAEMNQALGGGDSNYPRCPSDPAICNTYLDCTETQLYPCTIGECATFGC